MNQAGRGASERTSDEVVTESGNVKVEDDDRVYVTAGEVIAGKYRVERILGVGGMGFVVAVVNAAPGVNEDGPIVSDGKLPGVSDLVGKYCRAEAIWERDAG